MITGQPRTCRTECCTRDRVDSAGRDVDAAARAESVSAALVLALAVGLLQAAFFLLAAPTLVSSMGVAADSAMRPIALSDGPHPHPGGSTRNLLWRP